MAKASQTKVEDTVVDATVIEATSEVAPANPIEPAKAGNTYTLPDGTVVTHN
jgi:hypothetical protein